MTDQVILDTDVVIDYLRGKPAAVRFIEGLTSTPMLTVITVAELYRGVREGTERIELDSLIAQSTILPLELTAAIAGGLHLRQFAKSHGVGFADAIIAAIAQRYQRTLVTLNGRHFPMLADVFVPYVKP